VGARAPPLRSAAAVHRRRPTSDPPRTLAPLPPASGGKDSAYAALQARAAGHEVAALATLAPADAAADDLDSWMFQTVGHQAVGAWAALTGLPLFRARTRGVSVERGLLYAGSPGDEVEDLARVLAAAQAAVPGLAGVTSGAVASDYQRARVEAVAACLGLVSLAPMWRAPQPALLAAILAAGVDAVLVKVAGAGLSVERHLGARLANVAADLPALRRRFGLSPCGEGGEYETLVLDCPLFTRGRLVLDAADKVTVAPDALAPVAFLRPTAFHVELKAGADGVPAGEIVEVPDDFAAPASAAPAAAAADGAAPPAFEVRLAAAAGAAGAALSLAATVGGAPAAAATPAGTAAALAAALGAIAAALPAHGARWEDCLFVHLYVPSMAQFGAANAAYAAFLPALAPPARATVELAPGGGAALVAEALFARPRAAAGRCVLHVQSVSPWAPACIGPYAQGCSARGLLLLAGQIPLDPASMELPPGAGPRAQAARALRSAAAVSVALRADLPSAALWWAVFTADGGGGGARRAAGAALDALMARGAVEGPEEGAELEDVEGAGAEGKNERDGSGADSEEGSEEDSDADLDDYLRPPRAPRHWAPQLTFVSVPALPRGCAVEVQPAAWVPEEEEPAAAGGSGSSSSSSSSDGGDGRPAWVRALRGDVAAEAPLAGGGALRVRCLAAPGRLARVQAFLHAGAAGPLAGAVLAAGAGAAAAAALARLRAAGFDPADVVAAKVYLASGGAEAGGAEAVRAAVAAALAPLEAPLVTVTAVGGDAAADAALAMELLALR
jgi:diphthine-ammonia ligase